MHGADKLQPKLILIAGPNGSGKSTSYAGLIAAGKLTQEAVFINPDVYAKAMAEKLGYPNVNVLPPELKARAYLEAGKIALRARQSCLEHRQTFFIETTASSARIIKLIEKAKENGYLVRTNFVVLRSPQLNNLRIKQRAAAGGHYVEPDVVARRFYRAQQLMPELLAVSDEARLVDNTYLFDTELVKSGDLIRFFPNHNSDSARLTEVLKEMRKINPALKIAEHSDGAGS